MTRNRRFVIAFRTLVLIAALAALPAVAGAGPLEEADAAFAAGDHARALELYEALIAGGNADPRVRLRAAKLASWRREFDRALAHFDVLLADDERNVAAWVGRGRVQSWSGDLAGARRSYERALAIDPDDRDAEIGMAYVALWSGDLRTAERRARALEAAHADHPDVVELRGAVRSRLAPSVRTWAERLSDTDDNTLDTLGVEGTWRPRAATTVAVGAARFEMDDPTGEASIDAVWARLVQATGRGRELSLRAGVDRFESTTGETDTELVGSVGHVWGTHRRTRFDLRASRESIRYSPTITDNRIRLDTLSAGVRGRAGTRWRWFAGASVGELTDDNSRDAAYAGFVWDAPVAAVDLDLGYTVRAFDYELDLDNGYFDPEDFLAHGATLRLRDTFGAREAYWEIGLAAGLQSFTRSGVETTNDRSLVADWLLGIPVGERNAVELYGNWGDYAAQNAGGFESRLYGFRFTWRGR